MAKQVLTKLNFIALQFGLDLKRFLQSFLRLHLFIRDWWWFRNVFIGRISLMPCLHDRYDEAGNTRSEYFWQDLLVARWIHDVQPRKHVDIGSRVDGFVAHVASFREIEVFDVREITTQIPGIVFKQADLMRDISEEVSKGSGYCDSLSCLHALEHFGLGRYGDPIDPSGYKRGITNMAQLIKPGGRLYLSTPLGQERVEFNAHRIFDPRTIIRCAESSGLILTKLTIIRAGGNVIDVQLNEKEMLSLVEERYVLGVFVFIKQTNKGGTEI